MVIYCKYGLIRDDDLLGG